MKNKKIVSIILTLIVLLNFSPLTVNAEAIPTSIVIPQMVIGDLSSFSEFQSRNPFATIIIAKDQFGNAMFSGCTFTYSIADTNIATVDANGVITAKEYVEGANTTTITISTVENPSLQEVLNITLRDIPSIPTSIIQADVTLNELATANISSAMVYDQFEKLMNSGYTLTYTIADTNIATVDANGVITAKEYVEGANTTTLTISAVGYSSLKKIININVLNIPDSPNIVTDEELQTILQNAKIDFKIDIIKNNEGSVNINNNLAVIKEMLEVQKPTNNKLLKEINSFIDALGENLIVLNGVTNKTLNKH